MTLYLIGTTRKLLHEAEDIRAKTPSNELMFRPVTLDRGARGKELKLSILQSTVKKVFENNFFGSQGIRASAVRSCRSSTVSVYYRGVQRVEWLESACFSIVEG